MTLDPKFAVEKEKKRREREKKIKNKYKKAKERNEKILRTIRSIRQIPGQTLVDYLDSIAILIDKEDFEAAKAIAMATCQFKYKPEVAWEQATTMEELKAFARMADGAIKVKEARKSMSFNKNKARYGDDREADKHNKARINPSSSYEAVGLNAIEEICKDAGIGPKTTEKVCEDRKKTEKTEAQQEQITEETMRRDFPEMTDPEKYSEGYSGEICTIPTIQGKMVRAKPRIENAKMTKMIETAVKRLIAGEYIRPTESMWNNLIRPAPKPDGSVRLCMNMMALNDITEDEMQIMPRTEDSYDALQGQQWFTVLDLKDGYYQIHIKEEDKHKTAFTINSKKYEWNRMPMGFKNAPMIFQRIINKELKEWMNVNCMAYMDDIIVYGRTVEEHDRVLREILEQLSRKNLKINMDKMQLRKKQVKFLGMIVDGKGVTRPKEIREEIMNFKIPKDKKELQRFMGAVNYHRRCVINLAEKTAMLTELLKDKASMSEWTEAHTKRFKEIQDEVDQNVIRYHPDYNKQFFLETDASNTGVGAIFYQRGEHGEREIIKPISAKLTDAEKKWGITEKEVYAIVWAIKKLEHYLVGKKFKVITDHKAAEWLRTKEDFGNARIARWIETIQEFNFSIEYRKGEEMCEADALSRKYEEDVFENKEESKQIEIIKKAHEKVEHRGVDATEYEVRTEYTRWDGQREQIKKIITDCETCCRNKVKDKGGSEFIETSTVLEIVGTDILEVENTYILTIIDYYTRYAWAQVIPRKEGKRVADTLDALFRKSGAPRKIVADRGLEFANKWMEDLCIRREIKLHLISTYHH
ncbi:hypothetical protein PAPHI01_2562 [Pancytospora philotis]|nr:hypothetical protein PAPHI01_2562 [Pancytospora philotis]